jgi:hypothetical protein
VLPASQFSCATPAHLQSHAQHWEKQREPSFAPSHASLLCAHNTRDSSGEVRGCVYLASQTMRGQHRFYTASMGLWTHSAPVQSHTHGPVPPLVAGDAKKPRCGEKRDSLFVEKRDAAEAAGRAEGMRTENVPMGPAVCAPDAPLDVLAELLPLAWNLNSGPENAWVGEPAPC